MLKLPEIQKIKSWYSRVLMITMLVVVASSCSLLKPDVYPDVTPDPGLYRDIEPGDSSNLAQVPWEELFTDTCLRSLISRALSYNNDLMVAEARVEKAGASLIHARLAFFPSLDAGFNASFQSRNPQGFGVPESYQLAGNASWQTGIWGKTRSLKRAALAGFYAGKAFRRAVETDVIASVAMNYYTLLALDAKLSITEMTLEKRISNEETMKVLKDNDVVTGADLVLSQANRYSAEVTIPDLKQQIFELENAINLLTGHEAGPVERSNLDTQDLSPELRPGIPAQLLSNRPDVMEAEYRLRASFAMIRAAKADFYPTFTLSASRGIAQASLPDLFAAPVLIWNVFGSVTQPLFNNGLNWQRLITARADQKEALAVFRKTLLQAGNEVVNAMYAYQSASDKIEIRAKQIEYLEKSVEYTTELLKYTSSTSYIDVLTAEVNLLSARLNSVNDKLQQMQAVVTLYQSLGGGWK